jgi:hypothetical protein
MQVAGPRTIAYHDGMTQSAEIELLNRIANSPEVLLEVAPGYLVVDMSTFFGNPRNVMLGDERGVVLFADQGAGRYEMHYLLTKALRGKSALYAIKEAIRALFTHHHASAITGATPRDNLAARAVNRALGGRPYGVCKDSLGRDCINYVLERATWVALSGA